MFKEAINNAHANSDYYDKGGRSEWSFDGIYHFTFNALKYMVYDITSLSLQVWPMRNLF